MSVNNDAARPDGFRPLELLIRASFRLPEGAREFIQKMIARAIYRLMSFFDRRGEMAFMNFGYARAGDARRQVGWDFSADLYRHVTDTVDLRGKDVLEVGCGRGGGSAIIAQHLGAGQVIGVDLSPSVIAFCKRRYTLPGLSFRTADAENLPFPDESFDAVVNVESSLHYPSMGRFLAQANRVLRRGGFLLFADVRNAPDVPALHAFVAASGLRVVREERITSNVVEALQLDAERRQGIVRQSLPQFLWPTGDEFAAVPGSRTFELLQSGQLEYFHFVLRKE